MPPPRERRDGCEGRRGGAAVPEGALPARPALAAARVPTPLPGLRAGAAAGARGVGAPPCRPPHPGLPCTRSAPSPQARSTLGAPVGLSRAREPWALPPSLQRPCQRPTSLHFARLRPWLRPPPLQSPAPPPSPPSGPGAHAPGALPFLQVPEGGNEPGGPQGWGWQGGVRGRLVLARAGGAWALSPGARPPLP